MLAGLQSHPWAYPVLEIVHIVGIALLFGNLVLFELRLFGRGALLPLAELARLALGVAVAGFVLAAVSGGLMFASQPQELLANDAFLLKLGLLLAGGTNAVLFHVRGGIRRADALARTQMLLSTMIWLAVLACGRWIAYL